MNQGIGERVNALIEALGIRKVEFARAIKVDQSFISQVTAGKRNASDRTIADICREFHVSETWLRTGEGEMFLPVDDDDELAQVMAEIKLSSDELIRTIIKSYWRLDDKGKAAIRQLVSDLAEAVEKEKAPGE